MIDGLDTKEMGLHDLRRQISIIPQVKVLVWAASVNDEVFIVFLTLRVEQPAHFFELQIYVRVLPTQTVQHVLIT